jgi:hypothetical protein
MSVTRSSGYAQNQLSAVIWYHDRGLRPPRHAAVTGAQSAMDLRDMAARADRLGDVGDSDPAH